MSTISPQARQELVTAVAERYQRSTPAERGRILDEFVALSQRPSAALTRIPTANRARPWRRRSSTAPYPRLPQRQSVSVPPVPDENDACGQNARRSHRPRSRLGAFIHIPG